MNYERFKKIIVSLALMCVFAFSTIVANVVPANAQGYYYPRNYYRWERRYDRDYGRYRPVYRYPWVGYRYQAINPYGYGYPYGYQYQYPSSYVYSYPYGYNSYGYYPYGYYPYGYYPYRHHGHFGRIGKLHWWWD